MAEIRPVTATAATATASVHWADPEREAAFGRWLGQIGPRHGLQPQSLRPASADASFRRYLRIDGALRSCIVMDAPPPQEDVRAFVHVATLLQQAGLNAPQVLEVDDMRGFLLLADLGTTLYLDALREEGRADSLVRDAVRALVRMQLKVPSSALPPYSDALLQRDLGLFPEWCVMREHGLVWTGTQQQQWSDICRLLIDSAQAQPLVAVHRDWMPRNLMVCEPNPGILDFQDAVAGPISYDIASLLRDAFISWDEEREIDWAVRWWEQARAAGLPVAGDFAEAWRQIEWMGLQRHLKVLGIFCRLKHRDGKPAYAEDLPRFFGYATRVALRYRPLKPLLGLLEPMSGTALGAGFTF